MAIKTFLDLETYTLARQFSNDIFELTLHFPIEEKYSLTDQIRRSSRSIKANIAEGWGKRSYINVFKRHLIDANGSLEETKSWCISALDCKYISEVIYMDLIKQAEVIGAKLWKLHNSWKDFESNQS